MRVDDFAGMGLELLGRGKRLTKKQRRRAIASAFVPLPGARIAAALKARRAKKGKMSSADKKRIARVVGAAALLPGAGSIALMIAAAKRRKAQRAAKKKSVGLSVVPPSALPAAVVVPSAPGVMAPITATPSYTPPDPAGDFDDPTENSFDDPTQDALEESDETDETDENETKNFWE